MTRPGRAELEMRLGLTQDLIAATNGSQTQSFPGYDAAAGRVSRSADYRGRRVNVGRKTGKRSAISNLMRTNSAAATVEASTVRILDFRRTEDTSIFNRSRTFDLLVLMG